MPAGTSEYQDVDGCTEVSGQGGRANRRAETRGKPPGGFKDRGAVLFSRKRLIEEASARTGAPLPPASRIHPRLPAAAPPHTHPSPPRRPALPSASPPPPPPPRCPRGVPAREGGCVWLKLRRGGTHLGAGPAMERGSPARRALPVLRLSAAPCARGPARAGGRARPRPPPPAAGPRPFPRRRRRRRRRPTDGPPGPALPAQGRAEGGREDGGRRLPPRLAPPPLPPPPPPRRRRPPGLRPFRRCRAAPPLPLFVRWERDPLPAPRTRPGTARPGPALGSAHRARSGHKGRAAAAGPGQVPRARPGLRERGRWEGCPFPGGGCLISGRLRTRRDARHAEGRKAGTNQALPLAEQEGDKQSRQEPASPECVSR
ncbi:proline-rich protein HaeIII subfamily 1-like [Agelaius tricolor]|uniref:proline-rich protein HaeIII subfamily 1-like n=1 Tax=Agelaius tricolor TaxID=9191 RepID=UPI0039F1CEFF